MIHFNPNTSNNLFAQNSKLLENSLSELEAFTKEELPKINKSNMGAIDALEQISNNLKAIMNVKK